MRPSDRGWIRSGEVLWSDSDGVVALRAAHPDEWALLYCDSKDQRREHTLFLDTMSIEPNTLMQAFPPARWDALNAVLRERLSHRDLRSDQLARSIVQTAFASLEDKEGIDLRELRRTLSKNFSTDAINRAIRRLSGPYLAPLDSSETILRPTFLSVLDFEEGHVASRVVDVAVRLFHERASSGFDFTFSLSEICRGANVEPPFAWRVLDLGLLFLSGGDADRLRPPLDIERISQCASLKDLVARLPEWSNAPASPSDPFHVDRPWITAPAALGRDGGLHHIAGWQHAPYTVPVAATPALSTHHHSQVGGLLLDQGAALPFGNRARQLVDEVNACHHAGAHTAALVLVRRLLEGSVIALFEQLQAVDEIKEASGDYKPLKGLINALCDSKRVRISKSVREARDQLHAVRWLGGVAAHNRHFVATESEARHAAVLVGPVLAELGSLLPSSVPTLPL